MAGVNTSGGVTVVDGKARSESGLLAGAREDDLRSGLASARDGARRDDHAASNHDTVFVSELTWVLECIPNIERS